MGFLETSALEGVNIDEAFHQMIECIVISYIRNFGTKQKYASCKRKSRTSKERNFTNKSIR